MSVYTEGQVDRLEGSIGVGCNLSLVVHPKGAPSRLLPGQWLDGRVSDCIVLLSMPSMPNC